MNNRGSLVAAVGAGAGLAYLFDPGRGARRRALIRDKVTHATAAARHAIETTGHDATHRAHGAAASLRGALRRSAVDDDILAERVRAKLGRVVSHPHAIRVSAADGVVTLRGPILSVEAGSLVQAVQRVRGVCEVVDELERHDEAGTVPSLQGGRTVPGDRAGWSPTTRCIASTAGAALVAVGVFRRDKAGAAAALAGAGLLARAATNLPLVRLASITSREAVGVQKTITIDAPVGEVFAFWSRYEKFPTFMSRVLSVTRSEDSTRSHWKVAGPGGIPVEFDAELTQAIPNQRLEWRTVDGAMVGHTGVVEFDSLADGRTRVHVRMSYEPPAGWLGHGVAVAFGVDPKHGMDADLARLKTLIETGHAPHDAAAHRVH